MTTTEWLTWAVSLVLLIIVWGAPSAPARPVADATQETRFAERDIELLSGVVPYSVWYQETPVPVRVPPPVPGDDGCVFTGAPLGPSGNIYTSLGSAAVASRAEPQVLSLSRVTIPPGSHLRLDQPGGSGLIVVELGWLELTDKAGDVRLTSAAFTEAPLPVDVRGGQAVSAGDRMAYDGDATLELRNTGDRPARLLTASVDPRPDTGL
jgi:hypothetical protein